MKGFFTILIVLFTAASAVAEAPASEASDSSIEKLRRIKAQVQINQSEKADGAIQQAASGERYLAQPEREETSRVSKTVQGLILCLGVFFVMVYFLKRTRPQGGAASEARLQLKERLSVGPKANVALLTIDGKEVLVGVSETQVSLLQEISPRRVTAKRPIPLTKSEVISCINE